jgi:hypothetical protein
MKATWPCQLIIWRPCLHVMLELKHRQSIKLTTIKPRTLPLAIGTSWKLIATPNKNLLLIIVFLVFINDNIWSVKCKTNILDFYVIITSLTSPWQLIVIFIIDMFCSNWTPYRFSYLNLHLRCNSAIRNQLLIDYNTRIISLPPMP